MARRFTLLPPAQPLQKQSAVQLQDSALQSQLSPVAVVQQVGGDIVVRRFPRLDDVIDCWA
jgi:hypothetical protein